MERDKQPFEKPIVVGRARRDLVDFMTTIPGATRITENPDGSQTHTVVAPGSDQVQ